MFLFCSSFELTGFQSSPFAQWTHCGPLVVLSCVHSPSVLLFLRTVLSSTWVCSVIPDARFQSLSLFFSILKFSKPQSFLPHMPSPAVYYWLCTVIFSGRGSLFFIWSPVILFDRLFTVPEVLMALNSVAAVLCCSWLVEDIWHKYGFHFQLEVRPPLSGAASVLSLLSDMFIVALSSARYMFVIAVIFGRRLVNRCIKMPSSYLSTLLNFP